MTIIHIPIYEEGFLILRLKVNKWNNGGAQQGPLEDPLRGT